MDGFIKMWYYGSIQEAEIADEHSILEVTPMFEISVSDERGSAQLLSIVRRSDNYHDFMWFAQVRLQNKGNVYYIIMCYLKTFFVLHTYFNLMLAWYVFKSIFNKKNL